MDNLGDPDIKFDKDGVSNYYYEFKKSLKLEFLMKKAELLLSQIVDKIKKMVEIKSTIV